MDDLLILTLIKTVIINCYYNFNKIMIFDNPGKITT